MTLVQLAGRPTQRQSLHIQIGDQVELRFGQLRAPHSKDSLNIPGRDNRCQLFRFVFFLHAACALVLDVDIKRGVFLLPQRPQLHHVLFFEVFGVSCDAYLRHLCLKLGQQGSMVHVYAGWFKQLLQVLLVVFEHRFDLFDEVGAVLYQL